MKPETLSPSESGLVTGLLSECGKALPLDLAGSLEAGLVRGLKKGGRLEACSVRRAWGRVQPIVALAVSPSLRGQGRGSRLVEDLRQELLRNELSTSGMELPGEAHAVAAFLCARGFKLSPPTLEAFLATSADDDGPGIGAAGDPPAPDEAGAARAGEEDRGPWPTAEEFASPPPAVRQATQSDCSGTDVQDLCSGLQAGFAPGAWLGESVAAGRLESLVWEHGRELLGLSWFCPEDSVLRVGGLLQRDGLGGPGGRALLTRMLSLARERGLAGLALRVPGRQADALRGLLAEGLVTRGSLLRLTVVGHPEAAGRGGTCLCDWA